MSLVKSLRRAKTAAMAAAAVAINAASKKGFIESAVPATREAPAKRGREAGLEALIEEQVAKASANEDCIKLKAVAMAYAAAAPRSGAAAKMRLRTPAKRGHSEVRGSGRQSSQAAVRQ
jgi:hypothetical protein